MIYSWVVPKKNHTSPTKEISAFHEGRGESYKEFLEFVQDVHKREGGIVNFLHGGYGYFLEQPILWKRKKKLLSRYKIPCIFNIIVAIKFCWIKHYCNVEIVCVCRCTWLVLLKMCNILQFLCKL